jgi:hypothetical protein
MFLTLPFLFSFISFAYQASKFFSLQKKFIPAFAGMTKKAQLERTPQAGQSALLHQLTLKKSRQNQAALRYITL